MNNYFPKKTISLITGLSILLILFIPTTYKVIKDHQNKLYAVVEKEIIEAAKNCWNKGVCEKDEITLKELYDLKYLKKQVDPITKKVYDYNSKIIKKNEKIELLLK